MPTHHAVVLGGGLAGTLVAHALAEHVDQVTIVERDDLPTGPEPRKGMPQGRHTHVFVEAGYTALEDLLPGILAELRARGARQLSHPDRILMNGPQGWRHRLPAMAGVLSASRALTDHAVRQRVLAHPRITVAPPTTVVGLLGDRRRVSGVRLRDRGATDTRRLTADLVVDTTGRSTKTHTWLTELGMPPVHSASIDPGLRYATRVYQAPPTAPETFPIVLIQPDPTVRRSVAAMLTPIEDHRWILTMVGPHHDPPPTDEADIDAFLRSQRDPVIADLVAVATPLTPLHGFANTVNRRHYYERTRSWPEGLLIAGDAYATFNPIYGHGMAVAAMTARALRDRWHRHHPLLPGACRRAQRHIARVTRPAWQLATAADLREPHTTTTGKPPGRLSRLQYAYMDRLFAALPGRPDLLRAQVRVLALLDSPLRLFAPGAALAVLRGPLDTALAEVPLTEEELRVLKPGDEFSGD
ncbi:2-polyprenyl-6-methoxyphenol hydroxylase-like FAD-dependent oxidoreductase [Crossiella equi]|uniref:2-polyprenyl-6-methoxyphenol hydroxylase-like FAD-dependent oxidoreductase n=1 Tax=Crossiella equi TaxID=130796 RepID=A0ABS5A5J1_9PSEU|nr:FAD-dependent monooxygenase [Crossiella equi]MBP2471489.1 2-polyprenyl-6-methoxyphenol hydroxylase-like FAD-dependent oxidoreductase [Crossiella equi]